MLATIFSTMPCPTYVADTPGNSALLARSGSLVSLALDAQVHDVVPANGTVVDNNVPRPQCDGVPLQLGQRFVRASNAGLPTFLTSKRFLSPSVPVLALPAFAFGAGAGASVMFTSAMV